MRIALFIFLLICYLRAEDDEEDNTKRRSKRDIRCARRLAAKNASTHIWGEVCCDAEIETIILEIMEDSSESLGDTARRLQKKVQDNHYHTFEVIISKEDFVVSSYYNGQRMCKISNNGLHILAYQTPTKYDIDDHGREASLAGTDAQEPLGSSLEINRTEFRDIRTDPLADIDSGTHCEREKREGNKCCSRMLYFAMTKALDDISTSPIFNSSFETPGVVANTIKRRAQKKFNKLFEIIVSRMDFAFATYSFSDLICKIFKKDLYILAYENPFQTHYDIANIEYEHGYSIISQEEMLGTNSYMLLGQKMPTGIELESDGYRLGFPKDSHCDHQKKTGSKCCHMELFQSMHDSVMDLKSDDSFSALDKRAIASKLRKQAELTINQPLEMIVSTEDFIVASNHQGDCVCKFKADDYHIMAWRVPGNYSVGQEFYADNGREDFAGCGPDNATMPNRFRRAENIKTQGGNGCCNRTLRYTMKKNFQSAMGAEGSPLNAQELSRKLARMTQAQYNSQVETIVSKGYFEFKSSGKRKMDACKIDLGGFNVMMFDIGGKPDPNEFLNSDVALGTNNDRNGDGNGAGGRGQGDGNANPNSNANSQSASQNEQSQDAQQAQAQQSSQANSQQQAQQAQQAPQQMQQSIQQASQQMIQQQSFQRAFAQPGQQIVQPPITQQQLAATSMSDMNPLFAPGMCFSGHCWVITDRGKKNMSDLNIGDFVLTADDSAVFFLPVSLWLHREPEKDGGFLEFTTVSGKSLHISPKHFIYHTTCQGDKFNVTTLPVTGEVFAYEVLVGDCFYLYEEGKWSLEKISTRQMVQKRGIYAPLTNNGKIIVNGFLASCYTDLSDQTIQNTYFEVMSNLEKRFHGWSNWLGLRSVAFGTGKPYLFQFYEELLYDILPTKYYYS